MELNDANRETLSRYLEQTLCADPDIRRPAERFLQSIERNEKYPLLLLRLLDSSPGDPQLLISAAITFKNFVKRNWKVDEEGVDHVTESDRTCVRRAIVDLMLRSPEPVQRQLSDAISIIGRCDFPQNWPQLLPDMSSKFASGDFHVINGCLRTAHSIFERYRFEFKSNELWIEIKFVLDNFAQPLTDLFVATMDLAELHKNNVVALRVIMSSLVIIADIFYSLNYQDLPEFFEDNISTWLPRFLELLKLENPLLAAESDDEPGLLEELRSRICDNASLYALKYEEEFQPYLPGFVTAIWGLLISIGGQPKYDLLVSNSIQFMSSVMERDHNRHLFESYEIVQSMCEKVIIPNMEFRLADEELFEDNPEEYIRRDVEGSDVDTRRRAACDLVKSIARLFEARVSQMFAHYVQLMIRRCAENRTLHWKSKDAAIYLVTSLATKASTQKSGATQIRPLVDIDDFYSTQIYPEIQDRQLDQWSVLKSASLKYLMVFRGQLSPRLVIGSLPAVIDQLRDPAIVLHSYAAMTIDKILTVRRDKQPLVSSADLAPLADDLFTNLLYALSLPGSLENEYAIKALMRSCSALQELAIPHLANVLPQLTGTLQIISKNPSQPNFNHYLFETFAIAVRLVCKSQPSVVSTFESTLFPIFQMILQQDVQEFTPYVFQLLSMMLETQPGVSGPYQALVPHLLAPVLWEQPGNIPPLVRFISACVRRDPQIFVRIDKLPAVLGVFQKLVASRANDHHGFTLITALFESMPEEAMEQYVKQVFLLMFQRLTSHKTAKFVRGMLAFLYLFAHLRGGARLIAVVDQIQAKMFGMVVERLIVPETQKVTSSADKLVCTAGLVALLCDTPQLVNGEYTNYWAPVMQTLIGLFELPEEEAEPDDVHFKELDLSATGYQAAYSQLMFAPPPKVDPLKGAVGEPRQYLMKGLQRLSASHPGRIATLISSGLAPEASAFLQKYAQTLGITLQ